MKTNFSTNAAIAIAKKNPSAISFDFHSRDSVKQAVGGRPPQYAPAPCDLDFWPSGLESGVRVTCDVGYLCANFSLPRPLRSRLRYATDVRQTDVRQHHRLMPRLGGRGIIIHQLRYAGTIGECDTYSLNISVPAVMHGIIFLRGRMEMETKLCRGAAT